MVGEKRIAFGQRRRQTSEIERHAAEQRRPIGSRAKDEPFVFQLRQNETIERLARLRSRCSTTAGSCGSLHRFERPMIAIRRRDRRFDDRRLIGDDRALGIGGVFLRECRWRMKTVANSPESRTEHQTRICESATSHLMPAPRARHALPPGRSAALRGRCDNRSARRLRPSRCRIVACRSWTWTLFSAARRPTASVAP